MSKTRIDTVDTGPPACVIHLLPLDICFRSTHTRKPVCISNVWSIICTGTRYFFFRILSHCYVGFEVSYQTPSLNSVFNFLLWQFSLQQVVLDVMQPPPLRSASPSFPRHLYHHHSLAWYEFFFSSQCMHIPLQPTFLEISPTFVVPLILSFLILSSLVTPTIHRNILISATSNFFSCAFFTAHVSAPYIIAGLTAVLYSYPLALKLILRYPLPVFPSWLYASSPHPSLHYLPMSLLDI